MLTIEGRKGIKITFDCDCPENCLDDISLFGMSDEEAKEAIKNLLLLRLICLFMLNSENVLTHLLSLADILGMGQMFRLLLGF